MRYGYAFGAAVLLLSSASGCRKKLPLTLKATATTATVKDYKDTPYAPPAAREIVTIAIESSPGTMVTLTGISTLSGKTSLDTFTDAKGAATLQVPFQDIRGPLALEATRYDPKSKKTDRAPLTDLVVQREPGIHVHYSSFDVAPSTCKGVVAGGVLSATGCPVGTRFTLGTATTTSTSATVSLSVDLSERISGLPATLDTAKPLRIPMPLSVALPGGKTYSTTFEATGLEQQVRDRIASVSKGGVSLGALDKKGTRHGAVLIEGRKWTLSGDAQLAREIDLVAYREEGGSRTSSCGNYTQRSTGKTQTLSLSLSDATATLYDRRSGRVVAKRTFRATGSCGDTAAAAAGGFSASVDDRDIQKWMSGYLR